MSRPPPSAQGESNSACDKPVSGADTPAPRRHSRKLRLGLAAFCLLLVAFVVLIAAFGAGRGQGVQIHLSKTKVAFDRQVFLYFAVTNTEICAVVLRHFHSDVQMNGLWLAHLRNHPLHLRLRSGQSTNLIVTGVLQATAYRGQLVWYEDASAFQKFRRRVQEQAAAIFKNPRMNPGRAPAPRWHTNAFPEYRP